MILGFKDQFVPFVEDGSKTHTIRAGQRWKAGMRADLFARPRQKGMRLLFRAMVTKVEAITITPRGIYICHDRPWVAEWAHTKATEWGMVKLTKDEAELFAFRDGFRFDPNSRGSFGLMMDFWKRTHKLPFHGQIIHWDYAQRFMRKDGGPDLGRDSGKSRELQAQGETAGDIAVPDTRERLCDERRTVIRRDSRERPA